MMEAHLLTFLRLLRPILELPDVKNPLTKPSQLPIQVVFSYKHFIQRFPKWRFRTFHIDVSLQNEPSLEATG